MERQKIRHVDRGGLEAVGSLSPFREGGYPVVKKFPEG